MKTGTGLTVLVLTLLVTQVDTVHGQQKSTPDTKPDAVRRLDPSVLDIPDLPLISNAVRVRVYESTLNKLAEAIAPVTFRGHYTFKVSACAFGECVWTKICESDWRVRVSQLRFAVTPSAIRITGTANASWCGVSASTELETTADVAHQPSIVLSAGLFGNFPGRLQRSEAVRITVNPTSLQPVLKYQSYTVKLPVHINVAPALTLPPIPLAAAPVAIETAAGTVRLRLSPSNVAIVKRQDYIELHSTMRLW